MMNLILISVVVSTLFCDPVPGPIFFFLITQTFKDQIALKRRINDCGIINVKLFVQDKGRIIHGICPLLLHNRVNKHCEVSDEFVGIDSSHGGGDGAAVFLCKQMM